MSEDKKTERACGNCGKPVFETENGVVHVDGGMVEKRCNECGWKGGQAEPFAGCPGCGSEMSLVDDHSAS